MWQDFNATRFLFLRPRVTLAQEAHALLAMETKGSTARTNASLRNQTLGGRQNEHLRKQRGNGKQLSWGHANRPSLAVDLCAPKDKARVADRHVSILSGPGSRNPCGWQPPGRHLPAS